MMEGSRAGSGRPKTHGSFGCGSGSATLVLTGDMCGGNYNFEICKVTTERRIVGRTEKKVPGGGGEVRGWRGEGEGELPNRESSYSPPPLDIDCIGV